MKYRRTGWFIIAASLAGCSSFGSVSPLLMEDEAELDRVAVECAAVTELGEW